ncbi:MAG: tetratricopeptide repeat protein [Trueperaceae bacterium]|nr:tetratricopeptide repeat protein [Trueperaceae bacterium]
MALGFGLSLVVGAMPAALAQEAPMSSLNDRARAALETARIDPGPATPDAPSWARAIELATQAVAAAESASDDTLHEALRLLAWSYQGAGWWSRAFATWERLESAGGSVDGADAAARRDAALQLAFSRYEAGDLEGALERFDAMLQTDPDDVAALRWIGRIALEQGRPDAARDAWGRLVELRPDDAGARFHLDLARERASYGRVASDAYRAGLNAYEAGDLAAAVQAFARAEATAPSWSEAARWHARTLFEADRDAAVPAWERIVAAHPGDETARWFLERARLQRTVGRPALLAADEARAASEAGDPAAALAAWRRALDEAPTWTDARLGVARTATAVGEAETALRAWNALLDDVPDDDPIHAEARQGLATARVLGRLGPEAARDYGAALAAYERGETDEAVRLLDRVVELAPDTVEPWTWLARIAFARGEWATAARAYEHASELEPANEDLAFFAEEARRMAGPETTAP